MDKAKYGIHHQVVADCPKCGMACVEDLGEDDMAEGMELSCPACDSEFELEGSL